MTVCCPDYPRPLRFQIVLRVAEIDKRELIVICRRCLVFEPLAPVIGDANPVNVLFARNQICKYKRMLISINHRFVTVFVFYRSLLAQYISQDVDGKYFGADGKIHTAKNYNFYGSFSCWDTYRSQHPLLTLIAHEHVNDFIKSIVAKTKQYGWLPGQHFQNVFGEGMVGDHLVPVVVDAYRKGFRDYDVDFIYNAMRTKALEFPKPPVSVDAARSGLKYTNELGYIAADRV
ncbi:MAG TPA: hypothetical protein ENN90_12485, partial [Mariniphaga anaerophila]|nr:hypothetical protein [Mariniphaga anaerophila]